MMKQLDRYRNWIVLAAVLVIRLSVDGETQWFVAALGITLMVCNSFEIWAETQTQTPLKFTLSDPDLMQDRDGDSDFYQELDGDFWNE